MLYLFLLNLRIVKMSRKKVFVVNHTILPLFIFNGETFSLSIDYLNSGDIQIRAIDPFLI